MDSWYEVRGPDVLLRLRIQSRASHEGIEDLQGGRLRVRVSAPPVEGAANDRLVRILAQALGIPRSALQITRGAKARDKDVLVRGAAASAADLISRLLPRESGGGMRSR